ncbi:MAG: FAD-binding oxidoreductase [Candidatus Solibacter sp.]
MAACPIEGRYPLVHAREVATVPIGTTAENEASYQARAAALAAGLQTARESGLPAGLGKTTSNLFRHRRPAVRHRLDVRPFHHVLRIDAERMTADVEGMITYEALAEETLRYGLLPAVVPQLKTITVGGAASGLGIESSSFRYGLVHETVESMEILTGTGAIVACSADRNKDLFFGFPNSYGTLGYVLRLTIRLVPASPYVYLTHTRFAAPDSFFNRLAQVCEQASADFVDATIFGSDEMYLTEAVFADGAPEVSDYTYMDIYYRSIQRKPSDWLTAKGYIWRWDTDWFWCSKHFGVQNPAIRLFARPALNSRTYQRVMRLSQKFVPASPRLESVIQDVDVSIAHAAEFREFLLKDIGILPVWVCPFKTSHRTYDLCPLAPNQLYVNFGFWDTVPTTHESGYYNRLVESKIAELGGAKGLYSTSYYDRPTFWSIYDKIRYDELKRTYDPDAVFPDLYAKCIERK